MWNDTKNINGNKLRFYRLFKDRLETESYVKGFTPYCQRRTLAKLRCGNLPLEIDLGRFNRPKTPLENRICKMCSMNVIENELHFMMECPLYNNLRYDQIQQMKCYITDFMLLPLTIQACETFNDKSVQHV